MKQIRIIRISFLICAALTICAFWAGFYYGNTQSDSKKLLTENTLDSYSDQHTGVSRGNTTNTQETTEETVDSMTIVNAETYYLRTNGDYLAVYKGDSSAVYFETDLKPEDLPETLQQKSETGLEFDSLEELYSFLENYSS